MNRWFVFKRVIVYFTVQGGDWDVANTVYMLPCLSVSQQRGGFDLCIPKLGSGDKASWLITVFWLFWTVGIAW